MSSVRLLVLPALVLARVGLVPSTTSTTGADVPARADDEPLALVDWNLHYGVSPLTAVDLEGIAVEIEATDPDVVTLQEVEPRLGVRRRHRHGHLARAPAQHDRPLRARGRPPVRQRGARALRAHRRRRPPAALRRRPAEPVRPVDHADHGRRDRPARDVHPHAAPRGEHPDPAGAAAGAGRRRAGHPAGAPRRATSTPSRAGRRSSCWSPRAGWRRTRRCSPRPRTSPRPRSTGCSARA